MKRLIILWLFTGCLVSTKAQMNIYSALAIPDSLRTDADIVIREESIKVLIKDKNTARYEVRQVFTILHERAKRFLQFRQYSDKFQVLDDAEIKLYDIMGIKKSSWSKKEMSSGKYGDELVPDGKITYFDVSTSSYPVTVEFIYSVKFKGIFVLPGYDMQSPWQSIQHSVYQVEVPTDLGVRYKLANTNQQPRLTKDGNKDVYNWEQNNVKSYKLEKHSGSPFSYEPTVLLGPNKFQLDDYDGDMTSWKNFGSWIDNLYAKTTALPEDKKQFYQQMVKSANTDREKAEILYNYMQRNMRYVSIQLGIGGLRPFPASFVDDKKYGDCKALSNYLKSALDAVGVKSNIVIIQGSMTPRDVYDDFSASYFNHAILNIPQQKDTIWLECTSTTLPFAQLGPWTENRKALMVTPGGGVLVNTPVSNFISNTESINTLIEVDEEGGAKVNMKYNLLGAARDRWLMYYHDLKEDEKRRFFISTREWKLPDVLEITNATGKDNPYLINGKMQYEKVYSFKAGTKLFFETRLYPVFDEEISDAEERMRDYYFTNPYQTFDTTVYKFPTGYSLETLPKNKTIKFSFGEYTSTYNWDASSRTLSSYTLLLINDRVVKAADYPLLMAFKKQVMADMNEKFVMKKE